MSPARAGAALVVLGSMLCLWGCSTDQGPTPLGREGYCASRDTNAVTVVIDYGDLGPQPFIGCASNLTEGARGVDALRALGITITEATRSPQFICRIEGYPTLDQVLEIPGRDSYTENCVATPPQSAYWTYWWAEESGQWTYSTQGYALHEVTFGGFEGYSFAHNTPSAEAQPRISTTPV